MESLGRLVDDVVKGKVRVPIARRMPMGEAAEAQRLVAAGGLGGKVVLVPEW